MSLHASRRNARRFLSPDFYIKQLLDRTAKVSDPNFEQFIGCDPLMTAVVIDDKGDGTVSDNNQWFNAGSAIGRDTPAEEYLTAQAYPTPPNVGSSGFNRDDFRYAFRSLVGGSELPDPDEETLVTTISGGVIRGAVLKPHCLYSGENPCIPDGEDSVKPLRRGGL